MRLEDFCQIVTVFFRQGVLRRVFLHNQALDDVGIYAGETALFQLLLKHANHWRVKLSVHQKHRVALFLGTLYETVLSFGVVGIEVDQVSFLVGLLVLDERAVFFVGKVFTVNVFEQGKILGALIEILLRKHAVVDEQLQVVPFLLVFLAVFLEERVQPVGHFLGDVGGYLLHIAVALEIAAAHIQWDVRRIDDAME